MFKRKNKISKEDFEFLNAVVSKLPSKYDYLKRQVTEEFLLGKEPNELGDKGTYTLLLNANLEKNYANKKLPRVSILKHIKIYNKKKKDYVFLVVFSTLVVR